MPVPDTISLDLAKHPYVVVSGNGTPLARFSNLPCAALTITLRHKKNPGTVITPEGHVLDKAACQDVLSSHATVKRFMNGAGPGPGERATA